jgi:hypothetical protein
MLNIEQKTAALSQSETSTYTPIPDEFLAEFGHYDAIFGRKTVIEPRGIPWQVEEHDPIFNRTRTGVQRDLAKVTYDKYGNVTEVKYTGKKGEKEMGPWEKNK